eukprot:scaffold7278_cov147-Skeletonema_marinoi.AAC.6
MTLMRVNNNIILAALLTLRLIGAPLLAQIRIDPFWILSWHPWQRALALGEYSIDTMMVRARYVAKCEAKGKNPRDLLL